MTIIIKGLIGYEPNETGLGVRAVPTVFWKFGNVIGEYDLPEEFVNTIRKRVSSLFTASHIEYDEIEVEFDISYQLIDGKELSFIDDIITATDNTSAGDPDYKHTIVPMLPSAGFSLPTRTVHIEVFQQDGTFIMACDVAGCLTKKLEINYAIAKEGEGVVIVKETLRSQRVIWSDPAPESNLYGATTGSVADPEGVQGQYYANRITNASQGSAPAQSIADTLSFLLRAATGYESDSKPFVVNPANANMVNIGGTLQLSAATPATYGTVSSGGLDLTTYLTGFGITIEIIYKETRVDRSGTNNYGADISEYLQHALIEDIVIGCTLALDTDSVVLAKQLDSFKKIKTNPIYIRIEKINNANDWIAFCFSPVSGTVNNVQTSLKSKFAFLQTMGFSTYSYDCKDITMIVGNAFTTLRALT